MPRSSTLPVAVAAVAALGLAGLGCGDDGAKPVGGAPPAPAGGGPTAAPPARPPLPRAKDIRWPKADVRVLLTGGEMGKMKPCGCSSPQTGGLERRAALWERLRENAGAPAAISLGDSLAGADDPRQNLLKSELHGAALVAMGYDGVLIATSELAQGPQPVVAAAECPRPPLNAKIREGGPAGACIGIDPILRFEKGGLKVRAVSLLDPTAIDSSATLLDAVIPPQAALSALVKEPGLLVVAAHAHRESLAAISRAAEGLADVVVVVDMAGEAAYDRPVEPHVPKRPLFVHVGEKGMAAGVLDLVRSGEAWTAAYRVVTLDPSLDEGDSALRAEVASLFDVYRRRVREQGLLETFPSFSDEDGPRYVGSAACAECHRAIYDSWKATPHARALATLERADYAWDPECVRCHVVGWQRSSGNAQWSRWTSGFRTPTSTPGLADVGCEDCHGPGSAHVREPDRADLWKPFGTPGARNWKDMERTGCQTCHDLDNSPTFVERYAAHYRPRVDHRDVPPERRTEWTKPK